MMCSLGLFLWALSICFKIPRNVLELFHWWLFASLLSCWTSWPGALTFLSALQLWLAVLLPESFSQLYVPVYLSRFSISWLYLWCLRALFYVLWTFLFHSLLFLFYRWGVFFFFLKIGWYILKFFSSPGLLFLLSAYFGFILCGRCFLYWAFNPFCVSANSAFIRSLFPWTIWNKLFPIETLSDKSPRLCVDTDGLQRGLRGSELCFRKLIVAQCAEDTEGAQGGGRIWPLRRLCE